MVGKNKIEGARAPWINIVVNYCCMRILLYAKMLKETKTEETIVFFVTFLLLVAFQLGRARVPCPPPPPPWLRLWSQRSLPQFDGEFTASPRRLQYFSTETALRIEKFLNRLKNCLLVGDSTVNELRLTIMYSIIRNRVAVKVAKV